MKRINPIDWLIYGACYLLYKGIKGLFGGGDKSNNR